MHTNFFITKFHLHVSANVGPPQGVRLQNTSSVVYGHSSRLDWHSKLCTTRNRAYLLKHFNIFNVLTITWPSLYSYKRMTTHNWTGIL
jgi:hypothetical protein